MIKDTDTKHTLAMREDGVHIVAIARVPLTLNEFCDELKTIRDALDVSILGDLHDFIRFISDLYFLSGFVVVCTSQ